MPLFKQLAIRRTAVALVGNAYVEVRIDTYAYPPFWSVNLCDGSTVCVRDVVSAAENDQALTVSKELRYDSRQTVMYLLERSVGTNVAQVEYAPSHVHRGQAVKLRSDSSWSSRGPGPPPASAHAFVLRTPEDDDLGSCVVIRVRVHKLT